MATLLGWKDILRPIRDGYRHLFPSPDTGPSPEERRRQRELHLLKGFTYFDTFEQLDAWDETCSTPMQRANTPLLRRHISPARDDLGKANVLLIHDYAGNYHDYEGAAAVGVTQESYSCEYLQYVESFIYFSHKLVCVPPPSWINTLHRNGVRVLGTLIIEPQTEGSEYLLQHTGYNDCVVFPAAQKLAHIAEHYGFDGWLINIEKSFANKDWNATVLTRFLAYLKTELGEDGRVVWYDALTTANKVSYQNSLTDANVPFAKASGSILTNYCWSDRHVDQALHCALDRDNDMYPSHIFFGIDVWAQNTSKLSQPRITYPEFGGGGTNTGVAVTKLASMGLAAGVFAPAWSFEHFPENGRHVERAIWEGLEFPGDVMCTCGDAETRHRPNHLFPITQYAKEAMAGSETFFYTDFSRAFGMHNDERARMQFEGRSIHAQLGSQSVLPSCTPNANQPESNILTSRLEDQSDHTQLVIEAQRRLTPGQDSDTYQLPLFKLHMPIDSPLRLTSTARNLNERDSGMEVSIYIRGDDSIQLSSFSPADDVQSIEALISTSTLNGHIQEIGIQLHGPLISQRNPSRLLEVMEICIQPQSAQRSTNFCTIHSLCIQRRQDLAIISWHYDCPRGTAATGPGIPYSNSTGPFAYFCVYVDGLSLGRAYTVEMIMPAMLSDQYSEGKLDVKVDGFAFDGRRIATAHNIL
ncbi:hypothetical protein ACN47E_004826 [Coniothyrium glycines]